MYAALLEDDERRVQAMRDVLERSFPDLELAHFDDAPSMIAWLPSHIGATAVVLLDHDLGPSRPSGTWERFEPGDGRDVTQALALLSPRVPVLIHSTNSLAVPTMLAHLAEAGWTARRVVPFNDLEWVEASWFPTLAELLGREAGA